MMIFRSKRKFSRFALAAAISMAVVIGCAGTGVHAADDDEEDLMDVKIFRGILKGLGLRTDEAAIDYRERSPLVLPPGKQLPPPDAAAAAKARTTAWPDDPTVKQAKQRKDLELNRKPFTEGKDDRPLLPNEYNQGAPTGRKAGEAATTSAEKSSNPMSAAELGSKSIFSNLGSIWAPKEEYTTFSGEPPRASLIEPPAGYRTPSPSQPYGVGKEKWTTPVPGLHESVK